MFRALSLGAGVQSSTVYLMMVEGEIEPADVAIFADTGDEPRRVYTWLDWLASVGQRRIPIHRVSAGTLSEATFRVRISRKNGMAYGKNFIPSFGRGQRGELHMLPRKCTHDFKLIPIQRELRRLVNPKRGARDVLAESIIGISWDEAHRMKPALKPWLRNVYPLVDRRLTRWHCLNWMQMHGYPEPPRSACVFCPYHSDREWSRLRTEEPEEFARAVQFERRLWDSAKQRNVVTREYLHRDCKPLDQIEFRDDSKQPDMFGNECEGMCGV